MTDLLVTLQSALHSARKSQEKDRTLLLGTILSAVRNHEIELRRTLTDDDVILVLQRGVKQRRKAEEQFARPGCTDGKVINQVVREELQAG